MRTRLFNVVVSVALALVVFVGAIPQARAFAPPPLPPIAPPVAGLCVTPWGAVACIGGAALLGGAVAILWLSDNGSGYEVMDEDEFIGLVSDGSGGWCLGIAETGCFTEGQAATQLTPSQLDELRDFLGDDGPDAWDPVTGDPEPYAPGEYFHVWESIDYPTGDLEEWGFSDLTAVMQECGGAVYCGNTGTADELYNYGDGGFRVDVDFNYTGSTPLCSTFSNTVVPFPGYGLAQAAGWSNCIAVRVAEATGASGTPGEGSTLGLLDEVPGDGSTCSSAGFGNYGYIAGDQAAGWVVCSSGTYEPDPKICNSEPWLTLGDVEACGYVTLVEYGSTYSTVLDTYNVPMGRVGIYEQGWLVTVTQCRDTAGNITPRISEAESAAQIGGVMPMPSMVCAPGETPISASISVCDSGTFENCLQVGGWEMPITVTPGTPEYQCVQLMTSPNPCPMWVEYYTGTMWAPCTAGVEGPCTDWWTNPGRDVLFRCGWGGNYYSASQCQVLREWYNVDEPTPETEYVPVAPPTYAPSPPDTESPIPDPENPAIPGTITGPSTPVTARPNTNWWESIITEWTTGATPDLQNSCWPQGWGLLNPLQWVLRPIMCALTWAFVPTTPVEVQLAEAWETATTTTKLGLLTDSVALLETVGTPSVGGSCGWGIDPVDAGPFTTPEVELIMCPSSYGLTSTASTARSWGYGVVGLWVVGMVYRWVGLGRSEEMPLEPEGMGGNL